MLLVSLGFVLTTSFAVASAVPAIQQVSSTSWDSFNKSVNGKLHAGVPLAAPCYLRYDNGTSPSAGHLDASTCASVQKSKNDAQFISDNFGGFISYNFAGCVRSGQSCPLSSDLPVSVVRPLTDVCYQGAVPNYYVDAQSVSDVQQSLAFASANKLPLVVKNTGPDYRGRSTAPNSFAIW